MTTDWFEESQTEPTWEKLGQTSNLQLIAKTNKEELMDESDSGGLSSIGDEDLSDIDHRLAGVPQPAVVLIPDPGPNPAQSLCCVSWDGTKTAYPHREQTIPCRKTFNEDECVDTLRRLMGLQRLSTRLDCMYWKHSMP